MSEPSAAPLAEDPAPLNEGSVHSHEDLAQSNEDPAESCEEAAPAREYLPILDVIRLAAIVMVVGVHTLADYATGPTAGILGTALHASFVIAVPLFIMISGGLNLAPGALKKGGAAFMTARLRRLIPAALAWTLIYQFVVLPALDAPLTPGMIVRNLLTADQSPQLYFLWLIMGLYALTPALASMMNRSRRHAWIVAAVATAWGLGVYLAPELFDYAGARTAVIIPSVFTFWLFYVGHYVLGYAVLAKPGPGEGSRSTHGGSGGVVPARATEDTRAGVRRVEPGRVSVARLSTGERSDGTRASIPPLLGPGLLAAGLALVAAIIVVCFAGIERTGLAALIHGNYQSPLVILAALALFAGLVHTFGAWRVGERAEKAFRALGNSSFGVFLVHFIPLYLLRSYVPGFDGSTLPSALLLWGVTLVLSWGIALAASRVPFVRAIF